MTDKDRPEDRQTQKPDHVHEGEDYLGICPWCNKLICWHCDGEHVRVHAQHDNAHEKHSSWVLEGKRVCKDCVDEFMKPPEPWEQD